MLLDGKAVAQKIRNEIHLSLKSFLPKKPGLAFILVGQHEPSLAYVKMKMKGCEEVGIISKVHHLDEKTKTQSLLDLVEALNEDPSVDGILIQQPLPIHLDSHKVLLAINPQKDVDGFHPLNLGKMLMQDSSGFLPCTPFGILELLAHYQLDFDGKQVVILGRSLIVGRPLANMLSQKRNFCNATVTLCHSGTKNLKEITKTADLLIAACGIAHFIKEEMVKEEAVVIDVGINRIFNGEKLIITGDVDFENVKKKAKALTPVPYGIGPMTIAMLLQNTQTSFLRKLSSSHFS
ncbi:MAG: bifunctional 5,10-methylenetetrahydrofolate dehydrogenase/5,10-methenyltetrahydrofolate cyclohydrolase [Chlamydiae bacterium]|nr:bifunctional 5,10-methylenetetrahydrofolate dehydrogenase/5,10-methenyltetrahydrofolate cyclohydrolase [Chlamydiota bacterium]